MIEFLIFLSTFLLIVYPKIFVKFQDAKQRITLAKIQINMIKEYSKDYKDWDTQIQNIATLYVKSALTLPITYQSNVLGYLESYLFHNGFITQADMANAWSKHGLLEFYGLTLRD